MENLVKYVLDPTLESEIRDGFDKLQVKVHGVDKEIILRWVIDVYLKGLQKGVDNSRLALDKITENIGIKNE